MREDHSLNAAVSGAPNGIEVGRERRAWIHDPRPTTYVFVPSRVSGEGFAARIRMTPSGSASLTGTPGFLAEYSGPKLGSHMNSGDSSPVAARSSRRSGMSW